jgi:hypothetical protein
MISYNVIICRKAAKNAERIRISRQEPHENVLTIDIEGYVYMVPYVEDDDVIFLKTIFPSRKYTKMYLRKDEK